MLLHGIEASFLAEASLRQLRTAIVKVVWSRRQSFASTRAVLSFRLVGILRFAWMLLAMSSA